MGGVDRGIRLVVAAILFYFGLVDTALIENGVVHGIMVLFGVLNTLTAVAGFCPLYTLADLSTLPKSKD